MKKDDAYRFIKNLIIEGYWDPEKSINVNDLAELLNMSRTPVQKALTQLEQVGFLTIIPQVGVFVRKPERKEVLERVFVCASLDALMAEQAASTLKDEDYIYLEATLREMDDPNLSNEEYSILNVAFHQTIYEASGFSFTINTAKELWEYLYFVGSLEALFKTKRRKRSQAEHWLIFFALKDRDGKLAKELIELHLRRVAEVIDQKFSNNSN
ncbi:GntR family transcriptional regulator [Alkalihalobacillus deserti]|uniref:GntR family transcriptional regulator n=1 Tax=Alkalihalobacillus deserti TaxID=2879466 RepID=UPI001D150499|nr:GntR family transcriptional regulator [Alkalihalobacillus deserti]